MRILYSWLRDFVEIHESPEDLAEALTLAGQAVDGVTEEGGESVLEFDITANRPDVLSHFGMAREVSAIFDRPLLPPSTDLAESGGNSSDHIQIEIANLDGCARYTGRVFRGVNVAPSPDWMRKRLELCGVRSINNIADLTNYVLLELGQPTHAFDLDLLEEAKIIVRFATDGEMLRTLDGEERKLKSQHLVIADANRAVALAGVMGGHDTEISDSTSNVLIEAAWFEPSVIRKATRPLGMHTEASHRFERGADVSAAAWANDRIATLLPKVSEGEVLTGVVDCYPQPAEKKIIDLRAARLKRVTGMDVPSDDVEQSLESLGFRTARAPQGWQVETPLHRRDVSREIDVVEEVARIYGYDRAPLMLPAAGTAAELAPHEVELTRLRTVARNLAYDESISLAFLSQAEAVEFSDDAPVALRNPISENAEVMRTTLLAGLVRAAEWNLNRNEFDVRLMEIGAIYGSKAGEYHEPQVMALAATGQCRRRSLAEPGKDYDFFEMKSDVLKLLEGFDVQRFRLDTSRRPNHFQEGSFAHILADGKIVGRFGALAAEVAKRRKIRQPVFLAELWLDVLLPYGLRRLQHRPLSRVPAVHRDLSLLVPEGIHFSSIVEAVGEPPFLVRVEPVEIFRGSQVPAGYYSVLLRAVWQKGEESLRDEEVNESAQAIIQSLSTKLDIQLRG